MQDEALEAQPPDTVLAVHAADAMALADRQSRACFIDLPHPLINAHVSSFLLNSHAVLTLITLAV